MTSLIVSSKQSGQRLDKFLATSLPTYSRSQIKCWILNKRVTVNSQISIFPKKRIISGELIEIKNINKSNIYHNNMIIPQNIYLHVIYEDNDVLVINKPSNMAVHPGAGIYCNTILNALLYRYPSSIEISNRAGIVHRLDKDTTGVMIIAKTDIAYNVLCQLFKNRKVYKKYEAVVFGRFSSNTGMIDKPIRRHTIQRTCMTVDITGKNAITRYSVIEEFNMYSRIFVYPETGRTHQIRVHMKYINHPLVGDQKYKKFMPISTKMSDKLQNYLRYFNRQALHACTLQLLHPITQVQMKWDAPLPKDMMFLINILKQNELT